MYKLFLSGPVICLDAGLVEPDAQAAYITNSLNGSVSLFVNWTTIDTQGKTFEISIE